MNCNYCSSQFDHSSHVPRLLIFCGHSLCEACCHQLHNNSRIQCPECLSNTFIEEVNFLPKNLALLKVNSISNNSNSYCLKHEKKYEAFCKKQKVLICVDCILHDSHRNHQMESIKNAHAQQQSALSNSIQYVENALRQTQIKYEENVNNQKLSTENYENCLDNLIQYFQEIKQLVQKQQQCLFFKLKQQYSSSIEKFHQKNAKYLSTVEQLTQSLGNLKQANRQSQIEFLSQVNAREQIIANINVNVEQSNKQLILSYPKNLIADNVIKSIQKSFKTCNGITTTTSMPSTNNTKPSSINTAAKSKKPSSIHGQQIPSLISIGSQQIPSNQNSKPMAKKITRKDPITGFSHPGAASMMVNKCGPNPPLGKFCTNVQNQKRSTIYKQKQYQRQKQKYDIAKNCDVSIVEQKQSLFNSFFSNMTSFLSDQKYIYAIGGFDDESSNMIKLNLNTLKWQHVSALKSPRSKFGCVAIEKNIFILGGKKGKQRLSDIQIWSDGQWKMAPALKRKRSGFGIVSFQNFIYIIGGNDGQNILNGVQILNTLTGQWSKTESMFQARDQLAVCLGKDNKIYAIGGFGGKSSEPLKTVQMFDIKTQKWHKVSPMLTQRRALAAAALADGIYAIGGFDGSKHLNSVERYGEDGSQWVKIANLKRGRCTHSAISIFDTQQIIVLGGFDEEALDSVEKYSLITNQWEQITKLPSPRFMHSCLILNQ